MFNYIFRRLTYVAIVNKRALRSSNNISLSFACNLENEYFCKLRTYCMLFPCLWPSNLPPANDWGYGKPGPDTWPSKYPAAGGKYQSPIEIMSSIVQPKEFEHPLKWNYKPDACKSLLNTGCGWRVDADGTDTELSGGPLTDTYELVQFHCHWGNCDSCGSEHIVDGHSYSGELHFVHWNKDQFSACSEAIPSPKGLTVIGVFLEVGEKNLEIEKLCELLTDIPNKDQRAQIESDIDIVSMYPADRSYWTYEGSLTTPPCYESVTWIVFKNPITVSEEQLSCFRSMKKTCPEENIENVGCVEKNFRPPQALNDREIFECSC